MRSHSALLAAVLAPAFALIPSPAPAGEAEIPALLLTIERGDRVAQDKAISRLSYLGAGPAVGMAIAERLESPVTSVRESAAYALAALPLAAKGATKQLLICLSDESPLARASCAGALGRAKAKGATRALAKAAADPQLSVRKAALGALVATGDPKEKSVAPAVQAALADSDLDVQAAACEAAGTLQVSGARAKLSELLAGPSELLRMPAAKALLRLGAPEGQKFADRLLAGDEAQRVDGARLLEGMKDAGAAKEQLLRMLKDPVLSVRCAAARSLVLRGEELGLAFLVIGASTAPDGAEALAYVRVLDDLAVPQEKRQAVLKKHKPRQ